MTDEEIDERADEIELDGATVAHMNRERLRAIPSNLRADLIRVAAERRALLEALRAACVANDGAETVRLARKLVGVGP